MIPDKDLTDDVLDEIIAGAKTSMEQYLALSLKAERSAGNSPVIPDTWIPVSERVPDPDSEQRVCVFTPSPHDDLRYRFVPASLFKTVCKDATHWHYMEPPAAPQEVKRCQNATPCFTPW